jgi:hypothetical protein
LDEALANLRRFILVAIIAIAHMDPMATRAQHELSLMLLSVTLGPAINATLIWFAYDDGDRVAQPGASTRVNTMGRDQHNKAHLVQTEHPGSERIIKISGYLRSFKELRQEIERRVPSEKWVRR